LPRVPANSPAFPTFLVCLFVLCFICLFTVALLYCCCLFVCLHDPPRFISICDVARYGACAQWRNSGSLAGNNFNPESEPRKRELCVHKVERESPLGPTDILHAVPADNLQYSISNLNLYHISSTAVCSGYYSYYYPIATLLSNVRIDCQDCIIGAIRRLNVSTAVQSCVCELLFDGCSRDCNVNSM